MQSRSITDNTPRTRSNEIGLNAHNRRPTTNPSTNPAKTSINTTPAENDNTNPCPTEPTLDR
jgi:hypothetical protein